MILSLPFLLINNLIQMFGSHLLLWTLTYILMPHLLQLIILLLSPPFLLLKKGGENNADNNNNSDDNDNDDINNDNADVPLLFIPLSTDVPFPLPIIPLPVLPSLLKRNVPVSLPIIPLPSLPPRSKADFPSLPSLPPDLREFCFHHYHRNLREILFLLYPFYLL